jgi:hypothetical protein
VGSETLSPHGIDNRAQEHYLEAMGFTIYPHTYSVGATSLTTMSRVLNVSLDVHDNHRKAVSGGGTMIKLLDQFGYETFGAFPSDYFFRGIVPSYDHYFPAHGSSIGLLIRAILEGEFRFDIDLDVSRDEYIDEKDSILSLQLEQPEFVYSHSNLPGHSQFSGVCRTDEVDLYAERLAEANIEMRHDVDTSLEADPHAIIIIAGDHGPFLTKNCAATAYKDAYDLAQITRQDIQERFGTFLAIRWPSEDYDDYDDITLLQDVFPSILAFMFKDPGLLTSRLEPISYDRYTISGAYIVDGMIVGGIDDGERLFLDSAAP